MSDAQGLSWGLKNMPYSSLDEDVDKRKHNAYLTA